MSGVQSELVDHDGSLKFCKCDIQGQFRNYKIYIINLVKLHAHSIYESKRVNVKLNYAWDLSHLTCLKTKHHYYQQI